MKLDFVFNVSGLDVSCRVLNKVPAGSVLVWDFGDNRVLEEPLIGRNIKYSYEKSGIYTITLLYDDGPNRVAVDRDVVVSDHIKTALSDSIYNLIDNYIPKEYNTKMTIEEKSMYINKWQLYIQPLVDHCIPVEEYSNELYYEGLENQLVMELAVYDFLYNKITLLLANTAGSLSNTITQDQGTEGTEGGGRDRVKQITTGPTEVQYYDDITESISALYKAYYQATQPGGWLDQFRTNLCMLASRLDIWLPICDQVKKTVVPKVVNRRNPGLLGGPNPSHLVKKSGTSVIK